MSRVPSTESEASGPHFLTDGICIVTLEKYLGSGTYTYDLKGALFKKRDAMNYQFSALFHRLEDGSARDYRGPLYLTERAFCTLRDTLERQCNDLAFESLPLGVVFWTRISPRRTDYFVEVVDDGFIQDNLDSTQYDIIFAIPRFARIEDNRCRRAAYRFLREEMVKGLGDLIDAYEKKHQGSKGISKFILRNAKKLSVGGKPISRSILKHLAAILERRLTSEGGT